MDLIISPNVPFVLASGAFDGFPTACCMEAALSGTAMFVTDELKLEMVQSPEGRSGLRHHPAARGNKSQIWLANTLNPHRASRV